MPEITLTLFALLATMLALGFVLGWILRGGRIAREKTAINTSWQEQMSAQKSEHDRLADQNKSLMEQISEYRASKKDSDLRAKELSSSLKEAFEKRDELQRQLKDVRSELDVNVAQRNKLRSDLERSGVKADATSSTLNDKDDKIFKLSRELESWKNRLPPLMERFRLRDLEAQEVEIELEKAQSRLADLDNFDARDDTRIEPIDSSPIADGLDASNDQYDETSAHAVAALDEMDSSPGDEAEQEDDAPMGAADDGSASGDDEEDTESGVFAVDDEEDEEAEGRADDDAESAREGGDEPEGADTDDDAEPGFDELAADHDEPGEEVGEEDGEEDDTSGSHIVAEALANSDAADDDAPAPADEEESTVLTGQFDAGADDDHREPADDDTDNDTDDDAQSGHIDALADVGDAAHEDDERHAAYSADHADDDDDPDESPDEGSAEVLSDDEEDTDTEMHADGGDGDDPDEDSAEDHSSGSDRLNHPVVDTSGVNGAATDDGHSASSSGNGASEPPSKDDLQQIKGVGPAIEKTLNGLGFYRFRQIAEMSEYDIDRVARELRGFRSRIYREDWIGQARMLQIGKSGTYTT